MDANAMEVLKARPGFTGHGCSGCSGGFGGQDWRTLSSWSLMAWPLLYKEGRDAEGFGEPATRELGLTMFYLTLRGEIELSVFDSWECPRGGDAKRELAERTEHVCFHSIFRRSAPSPRGSRLGEGRLENLPARFPERKPNLEWVS